MSNLSDLIDQIEPNKQALAGDLIAEIEWMRDQLASLRGDIAKSGAVEHYHNGKQELDRIAPAMQVYTTLVARYATVHKQLAALIPSDVADQGDALDQFLAELN